MKTSTTVVSLLFAFTTKLLFLGLANAANNPVLDSDGNEVQTGVEYYAVSVIRGAGGGGLAIGRAYNKACPEVVVQRRSDLNIGIPVILSYSNTSDTVVRESTDLNIEFLPIKDRRCLTSTVWQLGCYDSSAARWWVILGGVKGNPAPYTLTNWFKIEKSGSFGYKFRYCPSICESCITLCSDIGRDFDGQNMRLALDDSGWPFEFIKAESGMKHKTIKQVV